MQKGRLVKPMIYFVASKFRYLYSLETIQNDFQFSQFSKDSYLFLELSHKFHAIVLDAIAVQRKGQVQGNQHNHTKQNVKDRREDPST